MKNYTHHTYIRYPASLFSIVLIVILGLMPVISWAQTEDCCDCEKAVWKVKVTLMDGFAPVQSIDYKTFNGDIELTDKEEDEGEFPGRVKLNQYTFDEGGLVIRLNPENITRESGLGGVHRISETNMTIHIVASLAETQIWYKPEDDCSAPVDNIGLQDMDTDLKLYNLEKETAHSGGSEERVYSKLEQVQKYKFVGSYDIINNDVGSASWQLKPMVTINTENADCYKARCFMPIRVTFLWGDEEEEESEDVIGEQISSQENLNLRAVGTGQTTGHIIDVVAMNPTSNPITFTFGPAVTPATGKYQGYTIIDEISARVQPGKPVRIPVTGYCYDVHTKPVPADSEMGPVSEWITATEAGSAPQPGFTPPQNSAFEPVSSTDEELLVTYPGTDVPFPFTIDIRKHPGEAASFLLESMERIEEAYDDLHAVDLIETPFSYDPAKERESALQQTYWLLTSRLTGEPYTEDEFNAKLIDQFEENTKSDYEDAPQAMKDQLDAGAGDFWSTFVLVGDEAKVLKDTAEEDSTTSEQ